jgi:peptidoglycan/xylan/chitin deacetylase (PgdA/CDA1 family)
MLTHHKTIGFFTSALLLLTIVSYFNTISCWYFIAIALIWFAVVMIGSSFIWTNYHVKAYCSNNSETRKIIALTFDDGPSEVTLQILELLKKHNASATFFCIGKNIEKHPEILEQIVDNGHLVGNHSYQHSSLFDFYNKKQIIAEINKTDRLIYNAIKQNPRFFRPPYGVTTPSIRRALNFTKHHVIGWNIRSMDGIVNDEKKIFNRIKNRIKPGGIVLLHDVSEHSVKVLEKLLLFAAENKYHIVSLEQLLNIKAYED